MSQDFDCYYKSPRLQQATSRHHLNSPETQYIRMMQQLDQQSNPSPSRSIKLESYPESESKHWHRQE